MNVGVLISSNARYYMKTLPRLLHSLGGAGVPWQNIVVYVGQSDPLLTLDNTIHVPYNSFDYTSMIGFAENPLPFDKVHILHDTVTVGPFYWEKVQHYAEHTDVDCVVNNSNCGFWLYKAEALVRHRDALQRLKDIDKNKAIQEEGWFLRHRLGTILHAEPRDDVKFYYDDNKPVYGSDVKRVLEYHATWDVWKRKANYGQKGSGTYNDA